MRQKSKSGNQDRADAEQIMVEPAPFDIYLCDNCDAELYSKEAISVNMYILLYIPYIVT